MANRSPNEIWTEKRLLLKNRRLNNDVDIVSLFSLIVRRTTIIVPYVWITCG